MNATNFYNEIRSTLFGHLTVHQVEGIEAILDAWDKYAPDSDDRWVAYSLATAFWETSRTMQPIKELGEGRGRSYGKPVGPYDLVYYGRGLVQLTWLSNYERAMADLKALGIDADIVKTPDLVLEAAIAAPIMIKGMTEGWFTGKKLADYFSDKENDPVDARRIINGLDKAAQIAAYYEHFLEALRQ